MTIPTEVRQLPPRTQKARLTQPVGEVLPGGLIGWVVDNQERKEARNVQTIPDYVFRPDTNPELSFLVFAHEIEML